MDNPNAASERSLVRYLDVAEAISRDMLRKNDPRVACLQLLDNYLQVEVWGRAPAKPSMAALLVLNAGQLYLGASRMALSSHASAVYPLLRAALESACFGLLIHVQPELGDVWRNRHDSPEAHKKQRKALKFEHAVAALKPRSQDLYDAVRSLYEGAIDFGAHPNPRGVFPHVSVDEERSDDMVEIKVTALHGPGALETVRGLVACLDFGVAIAGVSALALDVPVSVVTDDLRRLLAAKVDAMAEVEEADEPA